MSKVIIVSNRLPVSIKLQGSRVQVSRSSGGLASGLGSAFGKQGGVWLGWPGAAYDNPRHQELVTRELKKQNLYPVFLSEEDQENFYEGYSNSVLWPNFHYFMQYVQFKPEYWPSYERVNRQFANLLVHIYKLYEPGDMIWIHDYHLLLLPAMLREMLPDATIGFFLHIPFPSFEIFRQLPQRCELLEGMLGADLLGFHTYDDVKHYTETTSRLLGVYSNMNELRLPDRVVQADIFPIGIDYKTFYQSTRKRSVQHEVNVYKELFKDQKLILSVDRLDFSKGIPDRLKAYERFLADNPDYHGRVSLVMVVVPSRDTVYHYALLKKEIDELVGYINSRYGSITWTPVYYFYKGFSFDSICAFYHLADVALVTPLRDGMNLVCKEYVACCIDQHGVLVLSEMAGAAKSLSYALRVNPFNHDAVARAIKQALEMPAAEQAERLASMQAQIRKYDSVHWFRQFMKRLAEARERQQNFASLKLNAQGVEDLVHQYEQAGQRLIMLDYDGTLVPYAATAMEATPDEAVKKLLTKLTADPANQVVVITGRDHINIDEWLGNPDLHMIAEHGVWEKAAGGKWRKTLQISKAWEASIKPIFEEWVNRTPGSYIEQKAFSLVWHYRMSDNELGELRARELVDTLKFVTANNNLQVMPGKKIIEVKDVRTNKGMAVANLLGSGRHQFILAIGDDETDEDLFKAVGERGVCIKVAEPSVNARYWVPTYREVRRLLTALAKADGIEDDEKTDADDKTFSPRRSLVA